MTSSCKVGVPYQECSGRSR